MRKNISIALVILLFGLLALSSCQSNSENKAEEKSPENPTIDIDDQRSQEAEMIREEIGASVHSTQEANGIRPTPSMLGENTLQLWQNPMLGAIHDETFLALESASKVSNMAVSAGYDNALTNEEMINIIVSIDEAKNDIDDVFYMFSVYYDTHGAYADEAISYLKDIESELGGIRNILEYLDDILYMDETILSSDLETFVNTSIQLKLGIDLARENCEKDYSQYDMAVDDWKAEWSMISPSVEATDTLQMFDLLDAYIELVYEYTDDEMVDHEEIERLLQANVNARHAIETIGGEDMQSWGESLTKMSRWLMNGDGMQIRYGFKNFALPIAELRKQYE